MHRFDRASGVVRAWTVIRYDALTLAEQPTTPDPDIKAQLLAEAWLERGPRGDDEQLLRRLRFAGRATTVERAAARRRPIRQHARRPAARRRAVAGDCPRPRPRGAAIAARPQRPERSTRLRRRRQSERGGQAAGAVRSGGNAQRRYAGGRRSSSRCSRRMDGRSR